VRVNLLSYLIEPILRFIKRFSFLCNISAAYILLWKWSYLSLSPILSETLLSNKFIFLPYIGPFLNPNRQVCISWYRILFRKWFRHFIVHVEYNLNFWRLPELKFGTNFLEKWKDDTSCKLVRVNLWTNS